MQRFLLASLIVVLSIKTGIADPVLGQMNGIWRADGRSLVIDTERMQGNWIVDKPFQRDELRIRNIVGRMVVFDIGSKSYIGLFEGNQLKLSDIGMGETVTLMRHRP